MMSVRNLTISHIANKQEKTTKCMQHKLLRVSASEIPTVNSYNYKLSKQKLQYFETI